MKNIKNSKQIIVLFYQVSRCLNLLKYLLSHLCTGNKELWDCLDPLTLQYHS